MGLAQYNNCGLKCEGSEDIASKVSHNRHFLRPHSHLKPPLQQTPANIRISLIVRKQGSMGYISAADSMGLSSLMFLWWAPKHMCVMKTELIIAVPGQFRVIQGR